MRSSLPEPTSEIRSRQVDVGRLSQERPWRNRSCQGFTLVEVVVGLVLLATLLVGILQAYGAHHRQLTLSRDRIIATQITDDMLAAWHGAPHGPPIRGAGFLVQQPGWMWQTQPIARQSVAGLPVDVIRFDIWSTARRSAASRLLSSVDIVRPIEPVIEGTDR